MYTYLKTIGLISGLFFVASIQVNAADQGFEAALASAGRPVADKERDATRKPAEVVGFLGLESGMSIMDVVAGGGFYTEVLSGAVGPDGKVVSQNNARLLTMRDGVNSTAMKARLDRLPNVEMLVVDMSSNETADSPAELPVDLGSVSYSLDDYVGTMDGAITALNLHDMYIRGGREGTVTFLQNIHKALKPGGVFGFIDHAGSPGQDNNALHRIDPAVAKELLAEAGFVLEAESDLLANPADDRTLHMRDESLGRNTDRMLFRLRKPVQTEMIALHMLNHK